MYGPTVSSAVLTFFGHKRKYKQKDNHSIYVDKYEIFYTLGNCFWNTISNRIIIHGMIIEILLLLTFP